MSEKTRQFMQNKKLDCKSRIWNLMYKICTDNFVLKIGSITTKVENMQLHNKNKL